MSLEELSSNAILNSVNACIFECSQQKPTKQARDHSPRLVRLYPFTPVSSSSSSGFRRLEEPDVPEEPDVDPPGVDSAM